MTPIANTRVTGENDFEISCAATQLMPIMLTTLLNWKPKKSKSVKLNRPQKDNDDSREHNV